MILCQKNKEKVEFILLLGDLIDSVLVTLLADINSLAWFTVAYGSIHNWLLAFICVHPTSFPKK